jgi:hypothetical protein
MPAAKKKPKRSAKGRQEPSAARKRAAQGASLAGALAEAAWAEADVALAQALADCDEAATAPDPASRAEALAVLAQSLARAGRKRGLIRIGELGKSAPFDPDRHDLIAQGAKKPKTVRIAARGVLRGGDVLAAPRVRPTGRKTKS